MGKCLSGQPTWSLIPNQRPQDHRHCLCCGVRVEFEELSTQIRGTRLRDVVQRLRVIVKSTPITKFVAFAALLIVGGGSQDGKHMRLCRGRLPEALQRPLCQGLQQEIQPLRRL